MRANYHPVGRTRQAPLLVCDEAKGVRTVHLAAHALHRVAHRLHTTRRRRDRPPIARHAHRSARLGRRGHLHHDVSVVAAAYKLLEIARVVPARTQQLDEGAWAHAAAWEGLRARVGVDHKGLKDVDHLDHVHPELRAADEDVPGLLPQCDLTHRTW